VPQRVKIETLQGKNPTEIHNALHEVCRRSVVDHSMVSGWASRFCEGRLNIQGDPRSWWPVTATDDTSMVIINTLLEEDRGKSFEEIAHEANMSTSSVFRIMTQCRNKVAAKWIPYQLTEEQKAEELLQHFEAEGEHFLNRIVATDEMD
jgi:predicted DNA-binding transcriptional regulator